jgi:hypothetical protein
MSGTSLYSKGFIIAHVGEIHTIPSTKSSFVNFTFESCRCTARGNEHVTTKSSQPLAHLATSQDRLYEVFSITRHVTKSEPLEEDIHFHLIAFLARLILIVQKHIQVARSEHAIMTAAIHTTLDSLGLPTDQTFSTAIEKWLAPLNWKAPVN